MLRTPAWTWTWTALRAAIAVVVAAAIIAQAVTTFGGAVTHHRDVATTVTNFFSFFTILSNVLTVAVMLWAVVWFCLRGRTDASPEPRSLAISLACVTTYMGITGIVYNTLLRGIELPQGTTVPWSNEVLHVIAPIFLLIDLFVGPRRRCLGWGAIALTLIFPLVWVVYTMVRGPLVTNPATGGASWYPYPFLDPNSPTTGGYGGAIAYVIGIAVGIAAVGALVVWVGRIRGRRDL
ncbi:Pr6Pr family membrane protein [Rathayibacter sp. KR2-224]|uniref:Pr6Pr family membrane protein n=1 Tax=Rathayibacter sp. KR2-224 TaxID=3400913 RepID=UPI003BFC59B8